MRVPIPVSKADRSRSRVALAMLVLVANASILNATHHHVAVLSREPSSAPTVSRRPNHSERLPGSSDRSHCATCRLQRVFSSSLRSSTITIDATVGVRSFADFRCDRPSLEARVVFSGRAPPLA